MKAVYTKNIYFSGGDFHELQAVFEDNESDIEAVAGECISAEFDQIAKAYGFDNADTEEMLAPREW